LRTTGALVLTIGLGVFAEAAQAGQPGSITFDIPAQPLAAALEAYSVATGIQVLYDSRLAAGRRSTPVEGSLTDEAALRALLEGSELIVRYTDTNDVVLLPLGGEDPALAGPPPGVAGTVLALDTLHVGGPAVIGASSGNQVDFSLYTDIVKADIQNALYRNADTRDGNYRIGIRLWVNPAGTVLRSEVFRSTGSRERDVSVVHALRGMAIRQAPPANMPQPISLVIVAHAP